MMSNRPWLILILICMVLSVFSVVAESDDEDRFSHEQELILPEGEYDYYSVELSGVHYQNTQPGLDDIRVRDSRGVYCPYIVKSSREEETSETRSYETVFIGIVEEDTPDVPVVHHDFQVVNYSDEREINTLVLETDTRDFSSQIQVLSRTAKGDWLPITTDTVYRLDDVVKLTVEMDEVSLSQFWRITVNTPSPFDTLSITPRLDRKRSNDQGFLKEISLDFEVSEENTNGRTVIQVHNPERLQLVSLSLDTGVFFKRTVQLRTGGSRLASKQLYRIPSGKDMAVDTTITPSSGWFRDETCEIVIENRDDEPLPIESISAQYRIEYIVFKPSGNPPYVLVYGHDDLDKPVYDLASYQDEVLAGKIAPVTPGAVQLNTVPKIHNETGKTLFTVIVIASATVLFALSLLIFFKKPGSTQ